MVRLYVLPSRGDHLALEAGERPRNCLMREFDSPEIAMSYQVGLRAGGGDGSNVVRESYLQMTVVFGGPDDERPRAGTFNFDSVGQKDAFRQGLEDGDGFADPAVYGADAALFGALEALYASEVERVFIKCEEGSLGLLKSFGARLGCYDAQRHGVAAETSGHVLTQIRQFPADFEIEFGVTADESVVESTVEHEGVEWMRNATLVFLRHEDGAVTTVGVLSVKTALPVGADLRAGLVDAVTEWVSKTEAGRRLWIDSRKNLNIGDLALNGAFSDPALLAALRQRGMDSVNCMVAETENAIAYDKVLVDPDKLEDVQISIPFLGAQP